jgi:hypothetical protein
MNKNFFATDSRGFPRKEKPDSGFSQIEKSDFEVPRKEKPDFGWRSAFSAAIKLYLLSRALAPEGIADPESQHCNCNHFTATLPDIPYSAGPWNERHTTCI